MRRVFLFGLVLLEPAGSAQSQFLSWGVEAGVPLNDAVNGFSSSTGTVSTNTGRWTLGPTVQLHLPLRLSIEVDALYRSESYQEMTGQHLLPNASINNWQFPFLGKYDLRGGLLRPFVDAGVTFRYLSGSGIGNPSSAGFTIGGGLTLKVLILRLSPELRYTRWNSATVLNPAFANQSQNQADFLVGFTY